MIPFKDKKVLPFIIFIISGFVVVTIIGLIIENRKVDQFPDIRLLGTIHGTIKDIKTERSSAYVVLQNNRKVFLFDSDNMSYEPHTLNQFLNVGDSIIKPNNTDTLYVLRAGKEFYFVIGKRVD